MHHAVEASDVETILAVGPSAAREAERAGSHRQALAHLRVDAPAPAPGGGARARRPARRLRVGALQRPSLPRRRRGRPRGGGAVRAARGAGRARRVPRPHLPAPVHGGGDRRGRAVRPARAGDPRAGRRRGGAGPRLALHGRDPRAHRRPGARRAAARACARPGGALGTAGPGGARAQLPRHRAHASSAIRAGWRCSAGASRWRSPRAGTSTPRAATATSPRCSGAAAGSTSSRLVVDEGLRFARERGFWSHAYNLEVHRCVVLVRRGDLGEAESGLRELVEGVDDPGMLYAYSVPWLGRVLARRGDPAAGEMLAAAWERALRQRLLLGLAYAGTRAGGVGVAGRRAGGRPARGRRAAAAHRPSRRRAVPGRAPALPRPRRPSRRAVRGLP